MFVEISFEINGSGDEIQLITEKIRREFDPYVTSGDICKFSMEDENGEIE